MRNRRAAQAIRLLVDSSAYFALLDRDDSYHSQALAIRDRLIAEGWRLFTTSFVLAETHALLVNRLSQQIATKFPQVRPGAYFPLARRPSQLASRFSSFCWRSAIVRSPRVRSRTPRIWSVLWRSPPVTGSGKSTVTRML